ncbi:MAG: hypothetical protein M3294_02190, partial [Pseudomonadota bacterium]|nr:hypothetical protein [Pseudomonadota bacterium]
LLCDLPAGFIDEPARQKSGKKLNCAHELSFWSLLRGKAGGAAWAGMGVLAASISIAVPAKHTLAFNPLNSEVALGTAQKNYQTTFKDKIVTNDGSVSSIIIINRLIASDGLLNLS